MAKDDLKCSGRPEQLCNLLVDKLSEEDGSSTMFVVGLPLSGKRETAELLGKRLGEKGCRVIKVRADRKCANTLQEIIFQLGEVGVKVDAESINRMLKMDDTEDGRLTIYKHSLKRALENADVPMIVIIVQATENLGEIMEDELIAHPPSSVSWIFISSMPLKVILSQDSCGSTYTNLHFDSGHMFFLPLPANSIASCDKKKEEIVKFLKQIRTFEDCEPFTFWEAYCMKMMGKPIPEWIERALDDYGLLSAAVMNSFRDAAQAPLPEGAVVDLEGQRSKMASDRVCKRKGRRPNWNIVPSYVGKCIPRDSGERRIWIEKENICARLDDETVSARETAANVGNLFIAAFDCCERHFTFKSETWEVKITESQRRQLIDSELLQKHILVKVPGGKVGKVKINPDIFKGLPQAIRDTKLD